MHVEFTTSFERDLDALKHETLASRIQAAIENVKSAKTLHDIHQLKSIAGAHHAYRIRVGTYRLGIYIQGETARFVHCLDRKEIYRFFP
jgi:mRNA interferase RelE/StbE